MICRHMRFPRPERPEQEWVPMGLRDAVCGLRSANPKFWADALRRHGLPVDEDDLRCRYNLDGTFERCPFFCSLDADDPGLC